VINQRKTGFALMELMIVVAIVGILAAIAYPSYVDQVNKVRRTDAQTALIELAARLQEFYIDQTPPTYIGASLEGDNPIFPNEAPLDGTKHYDLRLTGQTATTFNIQAIPKSTSPMNGDFTYILNARGVKQHNKGSSTAQDGWP
jgi:type IV pilus assembly protein PilE